MRIKTYSVAILATLCLLAVSMSSAWAKRKHGAVGPNDPTYKVYQLLDKSYGGKLNDFYLFAGLYDDPQNPANQLQRVVRVDYDKGRFFGRFRVYVRSVSKLTAAQTKAYNAKQVYHFGVSDDTEFEKINPGPLGQTGDLYLKSSSKGSLAPAPVTDLARQEYEMLLTQYILPALQKK